MDRVGFVLSLGFVIAMCALSVPLAQSQKAVKTACVLQLDK